MKEKMKLPPLEIIAEKVEGTNRQRIRSAGGTVLDRQNVYLKSQAWEMLAELAKDQGVSGSVVIARLIWEASKHKRAKRQTPN